jgi:uncharacterized membrane protein YciS (DUF1049 family)
MRISSDLCSGVSLFGAFVAACFALVGLMLLFSKHSLAKTLVILSIPGFFAGIVLFTVFYRESVRIKQVEAEEELIRKLALEKLEKDKLET